MKILLTKSSLWTVRPFGATIVEKSSISSSWIHSCSMLNIISWFVPLQDKGYHHDQWYVDLGLTLKSCKYLYESGSLKFSFFHSKGISILVFLHEHWHNEANDSRIWILSHICSFMLSLDPLASTLVLCKGIWTSEWLRAVITWKVPLLE